MQVTDRQREQVFFFYGDGFYFGTLIMFQDRGNILLIEMVEVKTLSVQCGQSQWEGFVGVEYVQRVCPESRCRKQNSEGKKKDDSLEKEYLKMEVGVLTQCGCCPIWNRQARIFQAGMPCKQTKLFYIKKKQPDQKETI